MEDIDILKIVNEKEKTILIENLKKEKEKNRILKEEKDSLQKELDAILNSRSYKLAQTIRKVLRRG